MQNWIFYSFVFTENLFQDSKERKIVLQTVKWYWPTLFGPSLRCQQLYYCARAQFSLSLYIRNHRYLWRNVPLLHTKTFFIPVFAYFFSLNLFPWTLHLYSMNVCWTKEYYMYVEVMEDVFLPSIGFFVKLLNLRWIDNVIGEFSFLHNAYVWLLYVAIKITIEDNIKSISIF